MAMPDMRHAALVLVGHGSSRNPRSSLATYRLAEAVRRRDVFAEVRECFWKEPPYIRDVIGEVGAEDVYVVPNFAGEGYFTHEVIPRELASAFDGKRRIHYTPPVGAHPRMGGVVRRRAMAAVSEAGIDPATACLLLVGHGSRRPGGSSSTALALADEMRRAAPFAEVRVAFLEESPEVAEWPAITAAAVVVVVPLLFGEGLHGSEDLPPLFGLAPDALAEHAATLVVGPAQVQGRRVWYCRGLGGDPEVVDIVLDQVAAAGARTTSGG